VITGFDPAYTNTAVDDTLWMDFPELNWEAAHIRWVNGFLTWRVHTIVLHGESYRMEAGIIKATAHSADETQYVCYVARINQYVIGRDAILTGYYGLASYKPGSAKPPVTLSPSNYPTAGDWIIPVPELTEAHNIELTFEFPYGLYGQQEDGSLVSQECILFAQYRVRGETWTNFYPSFTEQGDYADPDDWGIVGHHIKRKKPEAFYIQLKTLPLSEILLDPNKRYEVRVTAKSASTVKLVNVATIVYGSQDEDEEWPGFTYPGEPLLGIKALASGQISGKLDVQVDVERSKVWVYTGNEWVRKDANIHAWAVYDMLVNGYYDNDIDLCHPTYPYADNANGEAIYGCGIDPARIDYESFNTWAAYTHDTLGYALNIVFDTFLSAWDSILRICQEGRGMIFSEGTTIYAYTDKSSAPTQLFTAGNIQLDTFAQKYMGEKTKANSIEVSYFDADRHYEKTLIIMRSEDWDSSTDLSVPESITLYGTTSARQAESIARFLLMGNKLLNNVITFGVDVEALSAQAGNVVEVAHPLLGTGESGRIVSVTEHPGVAGQYTLVFDRTLTIAAGTSYQLKIWNTNGTIETKDGITGGVDTNTIEFSAAWKWSTIPEAYNPYSFGIAGTHTQKYCITEITRTNDLMRMLTLVQYDEDMYNVYAPADTDLDIRQGLFKSARVPTTSSDTPGEVANALNLASNLRLQETLSYNRVTGEYESNIVVTWDTVDGDPKGRWEVWFRDVDVSDVDWEGTHDAEETYDRDAKVELDGKTYISLEDGNTTIPFLVTDE